MIDFKNQENKLDNSITLGIIFFNPTKFDNFVGKGIYDKFCKIYLEPLKMALIQQDPHVVTAPNGVV